jgi:HNH endonuclease
MVLEEKNHFSIFISVRPAFEQILLKYDYLIQQIIRKYRSAGASYEYIKDFYFMAIEYLHSGKPVEETISSIIKSEKFSYLTTQVDPTQITSSDFTSERKSAIYIKDALLSAPKCKICGGLIHRNSISFDHIERKQDGGVGSIDNGQITHPYCNSTVKN